MTYEEFKKNFYAELVYGDDNEYLFLRFVDKNDKAHSGHVVMTSSDEEEAKENWCRRLYSDYGYEEEKKVVAQTTPTRLIYNPYEEGTDDWLKWEEYSS